jgi:hypothetical protein
MAAWFRTKRQQCRRFRARSFAARFQPEISKTSGNALPEVFY